MNKEETQSIDWGVFDSKYLKFEEDEPLDLTLTNWKQIEKTFGDEVNEALSFDVVDENGIEVEKILESTSRRLVRALKPLVMKAEKEGKGSFRCRITRLGSGKNTKYTVKPLSD